MQRNFVSSKFKVYATWDKISLNIKIIVKLEVFPLNSLLNTHATEHYNISLSNSTPG